MDRCRTEGVQFTAASFDYATWERHLRQLLDTTRAALPDVELVLCTPFSGRSTGAVRMAVTDSLAQTVRVAAADYDAVVVPFDSLFAALQDDQPAPKYWIWDGIHPTAAGHLRMADLWMQRCRAMLVSGEVTK